jgi:integrase
MTEGKGVSPDEKQGSARERRQRSGGAVAVGRKRTGTVLLIGGRWHGKFTSPDGTRTPWLPLARTIAPEDKAGAKADAARLAARGRHAGLKEDGGETFEKYAGRWLDDREGRVASVGDDRARIRDHVLPMLGALDVRTFTRDDIENLRDALDGKITKGELAWKTVASVWTLVTNTCADMVSAKKRDFRVRDDNPCRDVKPPERGARKAKQYLYPSEFLTFVTCEDVPLRLRRAVVIAIYTFVRDGELRELRWDGGDIDMDHGTLSITRALARTGAVKSTKSGETRRFGIEANLMPLLEAMHDEAKGKGPVVSFRDRHMSRDLRLWLMRAGVVRPELHQGDAHRKPLTWHDLRATGLTWLAVRGDDPLKIKQRAGHSTFSTTEGYIREGEAVRDGFGVVFPKLPKCLLGISSRNRPRTISGTGSSQKHGENGGGAGNRTRVRKRLAHASTYVAGTLHRSGSRLPAGSPRSYSPV